MVRPIAKELTQRELEVMHVFWEHGESTAKQVRDQLAQTGIDRAYVTVANLVRLLVEKGFLEAANAERPFRYKVIRSFQDVSRNLLQDMLGRVFGGSREKLLVCLLEQKSLSDTERATLENLLKEQDQ